MVHLTNIPLRLKLPQKLSEKERTEGLKEVEFRTEPWVSKPEVRSLLKDVYGVEVEKLNTAVFEGKPKQRRDGKTRLKGWKKVYATLKEPFVLPESHRPRK